MLFRSSRYTVRVTVTCAALNGIPATQAERVDVKVTSTGASWLNLTLSAYRTAY